MYTSAGAQTHAVVGEVDMVCWSWLMESHGLVSHCQSD